MQTENLIKFRDTILSLDESSYRSFNGISEAGFSVTFKNDTAKTIWNDAKSSLLIVRTSRNYYTNDKFPADVEVVDYDTVKRLTVECNREALIAIIKAYDSSFDEDEWNEFFRSSKMFTNHQPSNLQNKYVVEMGENGTSVEKEDLSEDLNSLKPYFDVY